MKKEPVSQTNKWVHKVFFPKLLVSTIWRYVFRNSKQRVQSETAAKITHGLSIAYVLIGSTFAGYGKFNHVIIDSGLSAGNYSTVICDINTLFCVSIN